MEGGVAPRSPLVGAVAPADMGLLVVCPYMASAVVHVLLMNGNNSSVRSNTYVCFTSAITSWSDRSNIEAVDGFTDALLPVLVVPG